MRKLIIIFLLFYPMERASAGICLALAGCAKAEVKGLPEIAAALQKWAALLPNLNDDIDGQIEDYIKRMDDLVLSSLNAAEKTYGNVLDNTDVRVQKWMQDLVVEIDKIGEEALNFIRKTLFEVECGTIGATTRIKDVINISWSIPIFQSKSVYIIDFSGKKKKFFYKGGVDEDFNQFEATYEALTDKLNSANINTPYEKVLNVALKRADISFTFTCQKQQATSGQKNHLWRGWEKAQKEYSLLQRMSEIN